MQCSNHLNSAQVNWGLVIQGGVLQISSDSDDQRIFLVLKFSISGFFCVGKFWQVFVWVACLKQGIFWGIQNNLKICDSSHVSRLGRSSGKFYGSEIQHEIFWALSFGPGIFLSFV